MILLADALASEGVPVLPNVIFGALAIVVGVLIVKYRDRLYRSIARGQEQVVGKNRTSLIKKLQSAFWVGVVGVWAILLGLVMIVFAIVGVTS